MSLRHVASAAPWLPTLQPFLPRLVLLEGKAAELYHLSVFERPIPTLLVRETLFAVDRTTTSCRELHDHLLAQGFTRKTVPSPLEGKEVLGYHRGDLGEVLFLTPPGKVRRGVTKDGLAALVDPHVGPTLEEPHPVEVSYLGKTFEVNIPSPGRFLLFSGSKVKLGKRVTARDMYTASRHFVLLMDLFVGSPEMREEALGELLEVKPHSLVKELRDNLKAQGPGAAVWESAEKLYRELNPALKGVELESWYWDFMKSVSKVLLDQKSGA